MMAVEQRAFDAGVTPEHLMERAGEAVASVARAMGSAKASFFVFCGQGNNGGDGLVAARILREQGCSVVVEMLGDLLKASQHTLANFEKLKAAGQSFTKISENEIHAGAVLIDAVFGIGLVRPAEGRFRDAIEQMNACRKKGAFILSIDIPSGLFADTGGTLGEAVIADRVVALHRLKPANLSKDFALKTEVADIGLGPFDSDTHGLNVLDLLDAKNKIPKRSQHGHKGTYGHVLALAGSLGKSGAAALCARAALRTGSGLVTALTPRECMDSVGYYSPECMAVLLESGPLSLKHLNQILDASENKSVLVMGPGIQRGPETTKLIGILLEELEIPCVLDADALNAISEDLGVLSKAKTELVLTPHPGEMARMMGVSTQEIQSNRVFAAKSFASEHQVVLVLKGANTAIANGEGHVFISPYGNPGMGTAGMGDVLAGVIASFVGQELNPTDAAICGVVAHARAGDLAAEQKGQLGLIATDVIEALPVVWASWNV
jgi:ADP-dependent NAD(P)H-hydrate dehydratase / NAD(P)H-hydrate epimerase